MSGDRRDLEALIRDARDRNAEAPPFSRVWRAALERRDRRRSRRRLALSAAALSAAVFLVVLLVPAPEGRGPAPELSTPDASELARALSEWQAPLDFLLEPPGGGLLGVDPRDTELRLPAHPLNLDFEEIL